MTSLVKINFELEQDVDGYPPVSVESIWATQDKILQNYVLDNIPFFERRATVGDMIRVSEKGGEYWFESVVARSNNSLIRVVFFEIECVSKVRDELAALGCSTEYMEAYKLVAVNIPSHVDLRAVQECLDAKVAAGEIDYEEPILRQPI